MLHRAIVFACLAVVCCKSAPDNADAAPPSEPANAPATPPTAAPSATAAASAECDPSCYYSEKCNRVQLNGDHPCCEPITKPDAKEAERCRKFEQEHGGATGGKSLQCDKTCEYSVQCKRVQTSGSTLPCCEPIMRPDPPTADKCRKIESLNGP